MTPLAFGRLTILAVALVALDIHGSIVGRAVAYGQALQQVEQDVRRQVAPPANVDPPASPGYLGLFADERNQQGRGLRVMEVMKGGPAERAGLTAGDLITAINGATMHTLDDMGQTLEPLAAGRKVEFQIQRAGVPLQLTVTLGVRPAPNDARSPRFGRQSDELPAPSDATAPAAAGPAIPSLAPPGISGAGISGSGISAPGGGPLLGVRTVMLDGERRGLFKIPASAFGALVTAVVSGSAADRIGLQPGMLITSLDGQPVDGPQTLAGLVRAAGPGRQVEIGFRDQNGETHRQMTVTGAGPPADPNAAMIPHTSLSPNGDMPPEIGLPQEIPPGPGMFPTGGASDKQLQIDALQQRIDLLESRIQRLEAALQAAPKP